MAGSDYERQLANLLDDQGYHVMRAPSSGGGTDRDLPDLFYARAIESPIAAELKTTDANVAYFDQEEVVGLQRFAAAFGATARLVARFKGDTSFYVVVPSDARKTDSGKLAVDTSTNYIREIHP